MTITPTKINVHTYTPPRRCIVLLSISSLGNAKEATRITLLSLAQGLVNQGKDVIVVCAKAQDLPDEEKIGSVHLYRYSFPFLSKLFFPLAAVMDLKKKNIRLAILHGFSSTPFFVLSTTLARTACYPAKVIHTLRSYSRRQWGNVGFFLLNLASHVVIPHRTFAERLWTIPKDKIAVIFSSIDHAQFFPQDKKRLKQKYGYEDSKVIFHYGGMWHNKGTHILLQAVPQIVAKDNKIRILLAPRYNDIRHLRALVEKLNIGKYVEFIRGDVKIEEYVNFADLVVLPYLSLQGTEGNPSCLLEAMACKTPVITSKLPEIKEITGNSVFFAEPNNIQDLAEKIIFALQHSSPAMIEEAYLRAQNFSINNSVQKHLQIYQRHHPFCE